jgi:hypothetical protein
MFMLYFLLIVLISSPNLRGKILADEEREGAKGGVSSVDSLVSLPPSPFSEGEVLLECHVLNEITTTGFFFVLFL